MLVVENLSYIHAHTESNALDNLSFRLQAGQALMVGGPSGSGKSTLLSVLSGLAPHYFKGRLSGRVELDGEMPSRLTLREWGFRVGLMMQNPEAQFLAGTVEEELVLSLRCRQLTGNQARKLASAALERFGLENIRGQSVFQLSEGQKQKVVLAALTAVKPKLLMLDEPSANLDSDSISELARVLTDLKAEGLSLIVADHRLNWLSGLCDHALILNRGRSALQGRRALIDDEPKRLALGLRPLNIAPPRKLEVKETRPETEALIVENLSFAYPGQNEIISRFNAQIPCGRVTVLTGPSGRGKTTLAKVLCGLEKAGGGRIYFSGDGAVEKFWGQVVLQNTDHQLYMPTVKAELDLAVRLERKKTNRRESESILADFGLGGLSDRHPHSLSGGEKQRLVVAVGQLAPTRLLVLDEPSSGLDGRNLRLMAAQIRRAAAGGAAVLVITHDPELAGLCADHHIML